MITFSLIKSCISLASNLRHHPLSMVRRIHIFYLLDSSIKTKKVVKWPFSSMFFCKWSSIWMEQSSCICSRMYCSVIWLFLPLVLDLIRRISFFISFFLFLLDRIIGYFWTFRKGEFSSNAICTPLIFENYQFIRFAVSTQLKNCCVWRPYALSVF